MLELKRILANRKTLLLFGIQLILHGIFFVFQCNDKKAITPTGEELTAYLDEYEGYVQSVQDNAEAMRENPLFGTEASFVYRNLQKTGEDYSRIEGIRPVFGENRGIMAVLQFNLSSFLLMLVGVYIVLCFLAERQKGLYLLVRCTGRGRMLLSLERIGILTAGLFAAALVLFGSNYILSTFFFPGCDLSRPVQSIPELGSVIGRYSIAGYFFLFVVRKTVSCLFACLLLYFCMSLFRSGFCIVAFFLLMLCEYLCYMFLIPTGKWSAAKYINLYTGMFCGTDYAHYYNLNLFGRPVGIVTAYDCFLFAGSVCMVLLCLFQYARQYPRSEYRTLRIIETLKVWISRHKPLPSLMTWELKKVMILQKGLLIFAVLFYLSYSASVESNYLDFRSEYVTHWYEDYSGEVDEEKVTAMYGKRQELQDAIERWEYSLQQQRQYEMEFLMAGKDVGMIQHYIQKLEDAIRENKLQITGLNVVISHAEDCLTYYRKTGLAVMLIDDSAYELLLHGDKQTILRNYLYTLLMVVLMMSGICACEKTAHMETVLHTLYRGRLQTLLRKIAIMLGICIIGTLSVHLVQFFQIEKVFGFKCQEVLVQSVPYLRGFPLQISIRQYLVLLYTVRVLISIAMGSAVMYLSSKFSRIATLAFGVFLLIIPMGFLTMWFSGGF